MAEILFFFREFCLVSVSYETKHENSSEYSEQKFGANFGAKLYSEQKFGANFGAKLNSEQKFGAKLYSEQKFGANFGAKFGMKIRKTFDLQLF